MSQRRLLLKQAFMADIIDRIKVDALRDRLRLMTERRFAGKAPHVRRVPVAANNHRI